MSTHEQERDALQRAIRGITEQLRGPGLSDVERLLLHADRRDLRIRLAELTGCGVTP